MTRKVLGRGLRALIPEPGESFPAHERGMPGVRQSSPLEAGPATLSPAETPAGDAPEALRSIDIDAVVANRRQPRSDWDEGGLEQLTQSIGQVGLLEPIIVRPKGEKFEIVAGERRWRACKAAGWKEIPALVRPMEDVESLSAALIENLQREDLNPVEEARAYEMLSMEYALTHDEIARRVAKDRSTVTNLMRLLKLSEPILQHVSRGTLSVGHARVLLSLPEHNRLAVAERIVKEGWTVRNAEAWVAKISGTGRGRPRALRRGIQKSEHLRRVEEDLCRHFGTEARIRLGRQGGRLEIRFHDEEELSRLLEQIGVVVV